MKRFVLIINFPIAPSYRWNLRLDILLLPAKINEILKLNKSETVLEECIGFKSKGDTQTQATHAVSIDGMPVIHGMAFSILLGMKSLLLIVQHTV